MSSYKVDSYVHRELFIVFIVKQYQHLCSSANGSTIVKCALISNAKKLMVSRLSNNIQWFNRSKTY